MRAQGNDLLRYRRAEALHEQGAFAEAAALLRECLHASPAWAAAHQLLGIVHADMGHFSAAINDFRHVSVLAPGQAGGWANLGAMLKVERRFDSALTAYDRAIALEPNNARIRVNRTVALLHAGRLREAWPDFEWRLALPEHRGIGIERLLPPLTELGDMRGRTILVTHEDGFGDTVQFMRYLPLLAELGARVLAWVPRPLVRTLRAMPGIAEVIDGDSTPPAYDFQCPFVSLPRVFSTDLATIPARIPYLTVDTELARAWAARLPADGLRVGLVWAGQGRPYLPGFSVLDSRRSMHLETLAPLAAVSGARFVSLQIGPAAAQAHDPQSGIAPYDPMAQVADFADTAAIIVNLDVIVSVDTSVAHLAGALGKPVLLLDRYDNCWRWLSGRSDSPWYPTLRIFRQKRPGEWEPVVKRVAAALRVIARSGATKQPGRRQ